MTGEVRRDRWGIPHLRADDVLALAHLQGREAARDRAWQMELARWRMEGRTAEYLGPDGLAWDRFAQQVRLEPTARDFHAGLDPETRAFVDAYVEGVNEGMPLGLAGAPEPALLGLGAYAGRPRPWEPWTPLGVFWAIHLLFGTFPGKLFNAHVADRLGEEWLDLFHTEGGPWHSGSNAWVIGGHRTRSGRPLIAGDPHRTIELPNAYQQVGLACPEFDVVGFTFPGVPGIQHFGHAGGVAWAITNAMADYQDLTTEQLRRQDGRLEARGVDGWEPVDDEIETVCVRGEGADGLEHPDRVAVPVVVTARGPIVTGLEQALAALGREASHVGEGTVTTEARPAAYSLRTPSQVTGDLGFGALLPLLRSRTVDDVTSALARWVEPVNSAVVADTSGAMRHLVVGKVARRNGANRVRPVPAWDPCHRWEGWLPGTVTDVDDVMVSANDRASGGGLGVEYSTPHRATRIRELIAERTDLTADDCAAIHVDTLNGQARLARELVSAAVVDGDAAAVRDVLLGWDGHSDPDSRGAAVFAAWRHELVGWFAEHPRLAPLLAPTGHSVLLESWLDVPLQIGLTWGPMARGVDRMGVDVAEGVRVALERVAAQGDRVSTWGDRHWFGAIHALEGLPGAPMLPRAAVPGDTGCVLAAGSAPGVTDRCSKGPVARYVWDLADRDASRWVVPGGASGAPDDEHGGDQLDAWLSGRLHRVDGTSHPRFDV
ncbi:penicillin amidase [Intrasporangium oryzae NRRL B-24470]|uniref:Penicillin amidase n=1 Tax=Intrasporangium oryzae NRRL B-24470 TaxID=1386089 RepID=W9GB18_9MICO|nr:penicillin acylase family protein [Intrasporangium oryzae]EWT03275.1 penicillin amidase [Intrasporangium oryzae NRRL B-24470]